MFRTTFLSSAALCLMVTVACGKALDDQHKAQSALHEAALKIVAAQAEADKKVQSAVAEMDEKISDAQDAFLKRREEYRHDTTINLVDLDRKVDGLAAKAKTATGKERAELDASLKQIRGSRADFAIDFGSLEHESATTWDATQARLDREWTALKTLVDQA
jgi:hypothetical protein